MTYKNLKDAKNLKIVGIEYDDPNGKHHSASQEFETYTYLDNFDEIRKLSDNDD